jgi:uncharacterized protein YqgC (DUF456 family)
MMLIGVVIGPLVGIYIAEYWSGSEDSLVIKKSGVDGFRQGLWMGPLVGLVVGLLLHGIRKGE